MARFDTLDAWLNWQEQFHPRPIDLGLDRVADVYRLLAIDGTKRRTITVAGTNGKGSCVAYLEAIYRAQGYKVGSYTSPHILKYNERIRVNGGAVSDQSICQAFSRIDELRGETSLSYFEFGTLAALNIFAAESVDIQLLEVGLGGRLDAVNIIDPDVAVVTTIAIDHVDWLGNTLEAIGREKAGIFRSGVPAVIGEELPPVSVVEVAKEKHARIMQLGQTFTYQKKSGGWDWQAGDFKLHDLPEPAFKGEHQYRNAAAILMSVTALQAMLPVGDAAIRQGLQEAQLKGRFQLIDADVPILLDVGHNPQAVKTLIHYLQDAFPATRVHGVFAMMKDKDIQGVLSMMRDYVDVWYLAPLKNPRAASEEIMLQYFHQQQIERVNAGYADFSAAFNAARNNASTGELILIFGSFFLVSEYLSKFA